MKFHGVYLASVLKTIFALLLIIALIYFIDRFTGNHLSSFFSTRCLDYRQKNYSIKLNDRLVNYSDAAKLRGVKASRNETELKEKISEGKLVRVRSGNKYIIEDMKYSSPYVTKESKALIEEIGRRFREKTSGKGIRGAKFIVTSMTRQTENMKSLKSNNSNASANSPHLYGNAFDITYKRFIARKLFLTNCDNKYLKEALAEVIWQLRAEKKCWATYERGQNCFHVVAR